MKKNAYISPSVGIEVVATELHILAGSDSLTGTNIDDLGVAEEDAPADMEGRSRRHNVWEDEEEEY